MNIPKQMINLLGAVVVIAVLVAGVTLAGLPLYSNAQATDASTRTVEQTNEIYEIQVAQLSAENERIDEIDADLASLEEEIPGLPRLDDVVEIVVAAAGTVEGTIQSIEAADLEVWTPRSGLDSDDGDDTAPTDGEATDEAATGEEATADATDAAAQDTATEAPADDAPAAEDSPQKQIPVTIEIAVPDAAAAAAFMDELGRGPRLIAPIDGTLEDGVLRVTALAFLRTGD
ncbi:hypothetical protein ACFUTX_05355 [Microbacterium sp. NPDC057407]|uniref:hypothetical protein n=1 Tax=Microbacterium sp. NPDC057407 TaxID=3346120 RepID=UPI00366F47EF